MFTKFKLHNINIYYDNSLEIVYDKNISFENISILKKVKNVMKMNIYFLNCIINSI